LSCSYDHKSAGPEVPEMHENPTANDKRIWNYCRAYLVKNKKSSRVTSGNRLLCSELKQDKEDSSPEEEKGQGLSDDDSECQM